MKIEITRKHENVLAKYHLIYIEYSSGKYFKHKLAIIFFNKTIFYGEYGL